MVHYMKYIEAIQDLSKVKGKTLFAAGGITGCPDWQAELYNHLQGFKEDWTFVNPRRPNFPMYDPSAAEEQIRWEYAALDKADAISFWFPKETLCPITLFELGKWIRSDKPLFIGTHLGYKRLLDVYIQTKLERPSIVVVSTITELSNLIKEKL